MSATALQILKAFAERAAEPADSGNCAVCDFDVANCKPPCIGFNARAALEAAAKAPGLADDPRLARAVATEISKARNGHLQAWRNTDLAAAALDAVDAYQRGGK